MFCVLHIKIIIMWNLVASALHSGWPQKSTLAYQLLCLSHSKKMSPFHYNNFCPRFVSGTLRFLVVLLIFSHPKKKLDICSSLSFSLLLMLLLLFVRKHFISHNLYFFPSDISIWWYLFHNSHIYALNKNELFLYI